MQIPKPRKNNLSAKIKIAPARRRPHMFNQPRLRIDLDRALKLAVVIRNPTLKTQHE
jgi:hypothetical protein